MTINVYRTSRKPTITEDDVLLNPTIKIKADDGFMYKITWQPNKPIFTYPLTKPTGKIIVHQIIRFAYHRKHTPVKSTGTHIDTFSYLVKDLNTVLDKLWETNSHIIIDFTDMYNDTTTKSYIKVKKSNSSLKANPMRAFKSKKVSANYTRMTGNVKPLGKNFRKLI